MIKDSSDESIKKEVSIRNVATQEFKIDIRSRNGKKDTQLIMKLICEMLLDQNETI